MVWIGISACWVLGCGKQPEATAPVAPAASVEASAPASVAASASAAAPVATTAPTAAPTAPPPSEEQVFWEALALVYDSQLPECKGGWTGDGEITIKDGKITRFAITEHTTPPKVIAALKGKAVPPVPASLKKSLEKPSYVSVCTGGHRPP